MVKCAKPPVALHNAGTCILVPFRYHRGRSSRSCSPWMTPLAIIASASTLPTGSNKSTKPNAANASRSRPKRKSACAVKTKPSSAIIMTGSISDEIPAVSHQPSGLDLHHRRDRRDRLDDHEHPANHELSVRDTNDQRH